MKNVFRPAPGMSLVVSLVLLLLVTLIALASTRGVLLETRMSTGTQDRNLAFQAAEAALRGAETQALTATVPAAGSGCNAGLCSTPAATDKPRWLDSAFTGWAAAPTVPVSGDAVTPETITEYMGDDAANWQGCESELPRQPNCRTARYRITSRSTADGRATAIVQGDFAAP